MTSHTTDNEAIDATRKWVDDIVVGLNFCPFAKPEVLKNSIRYAVTQQDNIRDFLDELISECQLLDNTPSIETSLLIYPAKLESFFDYLDFLSIAEQLISAHGYDGVYQIASFHPDYCFDGCQNEDPSNYTNRSPYPMLHLLREESLEKVLDAISHPEAIPERNIQKATELGADHLKALLAQCFIHAKPKV